jgi:hypothetical protein
MENINEAIMRKAKSRVKFKRSLFTYLVVNSFLWFLWLIGDPQYDSLIPWPIYPTLGWGIGLAFQGYSAYYGISEDAVQKEYDKIMRKQS